MATVVMRRTAAVVYVATVVMQLATVVMHVAARVLRERTGEIAAGTVVMYRAAALSPLPAASTQKRKSALRSRTLEAPSPERLVQILKLALPRPAGV